MDELKVLREKDRKATRQIAALEKERDELRDELASAGAQIGPEAKSFRRLLADFNKHQEKVNKLKKDIKELQGTEVYEKYMTAKSNYVISAGYAT